MSKHTPGPWTFREVDSNEIHIDTGIEPTLKFDTWISMAIVNGSDLEKLGPSVAQANARLIAAAPELLKALSDLRKACVEAYKAGHISAEPFVRAGNIIAKAKGEIGQ